MKLLPTGRGKIVEGETYTHAESTTKVAEGDPGAGISGVIHDVCIIEGEAGGGDGRIRRVRVEAGAKASEGISSWI